MITPHASARQSWHLADACYHGLRLAGWLAVTLLAADVVLGWWRDRVARRNANEDSELSSSG